MNDPALNDALTVLYYSFGRAARTAQRMEEELVALVLIPAMLDKPPETAAELNKLRDKLSHSTLGRLFLELRPAVHINEEAERVCDEVLARRNAMMHHFFTKNASELETLEGIDRLIQKLEENDRHFGGAYVTFQMINSNLKSKHGISAESIAELVKVFSTVEAD